LSGLSSTIPLFETQTNTNSEGNVADGQLEAHLNNQGKVILVGPKYQLTYADGLHLTNTSSKYMGEMYAKVMNKVLYQGQTWNPLMPTSVTNVGNVVTVGFNIPVSPLVIDTTNVAGRPNDGFEFEQTGGSAITISSVSLIDSNTKVQITLSATPDGTNPQIRYAWDCYGNEGDPAYNTCGGASINTDVGGNIRDSDSSTSPSSAGTGLALYNWLVSFP